MDTEGNPIGFTGLHGGALFGTVEIMVSLLQIKKWDLNATNLSGRTTLAWAVRGGHDVAVKMLLEQEGVSPDIADNRGQTPFSCASKDGRDGIAKMLLETNKVNPAAADKVGLTPFSLAAACGREEIVKMLLQRKDVNPDTPDKSGRTPLSWAAISGCEGTVKILLERNDVNPDMADDRGRTPSQCASENGCAKVTQLLQGPRRLIAKSTPGEELQVPAMNGQNARGVPGSKFSMGTRMRTDSPPQKTPPPVLFPFCAVHSYKYSLSSGLDEHQRVTNRD